MLFDFRYFFISIFGKYILKKSINTYYIKIKINIFMETKVFFFNCDLKKFRLYIFCLILKFLLYSTFTIQYTITLCTGIQYIVQRTLKLINIRKKIYKSLQLFVKIIYLNLKVPSD